MIVRLWGTRGSMASAGAQTARYGGNTACVEVRASDGRLVILDAGTGIQRLGRTLAPDIDRIDVLLTHLHMDHIQGLGFFAPVFRRGCQIHIWGPASPTRDLRGRIGRYMSPPLFPVRLRDLKATFHLHDTPVESFQLGGLTITAAPVIHPGPTLGYRIHENGTALAYLSDHEPALGSGEKPADPAWTSGYTLAADADLLIHDAQYTPEERTMRIGWGHSSVPEALAFAQLTRARRLVLFHHDPTRTDDDLDAMLAAALVQSDGRLIVAGHEGDEFRV